MKREYDSFKESKKFRLKQLIGFSILVIIAGLIALFVSSVIRFSYMLIADIQHEKSKPKVEEVVTLTPQEEFIKKHEKDVKKASKKYNVYGSVMMAQAILESSWGNSELSQESNNYFGIKGEFKGEGKNYDTQEEVDGKLKDENAKFRVYPDVYSSFADNGELLRKSDYYVKVRRENTKTYKDATKALTGVYATDTSYDKKLNAIIEENKLEYLDN